METSESHDSSFDIRFRRRPEYMPIDLTKPLRVRFENGLTVPVTDVILLSDTRAHAYWSGIGDKQFVEFKQFAEFGALSGRGSTGNARLENVPEKRVHEDWINKYADSFDIHHESRESADKHMISYHGKALNRIACLHIRHEYEEGEGL